jgi:K+-sensing histidine kinase KdpD
MIDRTLDAGTGKTGDWSELLVPFDGSRGAEKVLRRACRAARRDDNGVAVLCLVRLPLQDEAAWDDPDLDSTAMAALARAQVICREEGVVGVFKLNYARNLVDAIVEEARRSNAGLICMSLDEFDEHARRSRPSWRQRHARSCWTIRASSRGPSGRRTRADRWTCRRIEPVSAADGLAALASGAAARAARAPGGGRGHGGRHRGQLGGHWPG